MRKINWSDTAQFDYWDNIDFLLRRWTLKEVHNFMDKTEEILNILKKENTTFKPTNYENTFQVVVTKQITLYYKVNNDNDIELLRFFNTYQNPDKLLL